MKGLIIVFALSFGILSAAAQQPQASMKTRFGIPSIKGLKIGDSVPDFIIPKLYNSIRRTVNSRDFKDKLWIIDFWYVGCSSCIEALPKMEQLQKEFGSKIAILPATYDPETRVIPFWKANRYTNKLSLPTVVDDKVLLSYFDYIAAPHEVWVYKGRVIAITNADYVKSENIRKVLDGERIDWYVKDDFIRFDGRKQVLFRPDTNQIAKNTFMKYAAISGYRKGTGENSTQVANVNRGVVRDAAKKTIRVFEVNKPIFSLYLLNVFLSDQKAFLKKIRPSIGNPNEVIWQVSDKYRYLKDPQLTDYEWDKLHAICYESLNPDTGQTQEAISKSVLNDLDKLLGIKVYWERRKEKVLVLVRTTAEDKLKPRKEVSESIVGKGAIDHTYIEKGRLHQFKSEFLINLSWRMNQQPGNPYVFDETGYNERVDMVLNFDSWTDIQGIKKAIAPYGLALKEEEREVDKLVFKEVDGGLLVDVAMAKAAKEKRLSQKNMSTPTAKEQQDFMEINQKRRGVNTLASGLQYQVVRPGNGPKPTLADQVSIHYEGRLTNGRIFDSSYENGRPSSFRLSGVIKGWQEALQQMPVGAKWILYLPAALAYGPGTGNGKFPPNSNLIFEMELISISGKNN